MACRPLLILKGLFVQHVSSNFKYKQCRERSMNFCINLHRLLETKLSPVFHERGVFSRHFDRCCVLPCCASNEPLWTWIVFKQLNQRLATLNCKKINRMLKSWGQTLEKVGSQHRLVWERVSSSQRWRGEDTTFIPLSAEGLCSDCMKFKAHHFAPAHQKSRDHKLI